MTRANVIWLLIAGYLSAVFLGFLGTIVLLVVVWAVMWARERYEFRFDVTLPEKVEEAEERAVEAEERERVVREAAVEYADRLETTAFSISNAHRKLREALRRDGG